MTIWSKILADIEVEKTLSFATSGNPERKTANKTMIQKILRELKLALPIIEVYSG